jgi:hypothetical protein
MELWVTVWSPTRDCWYWVLGELRIIGIFHPIPAARTVWDVMHEGAD